MEAGLLRAIVVNEVEHIVGTLLQEELCNLEKNMNPQEANIYNQVLAIFKSELTDGIIADPTALQQMMHSVIASTLIALARCSCGIGASNTQPPGLVDAMKNAYLCIRSLFSTSK